MVRKNTALLRHSKRNTVKAVFSFSKNYATYLLCLKKGKEHGNNDCRRIKKELIQHNRFRH